MKDWGDGPGVNLLLFIVEGGGGIHVISRTRRVGELFSDHDTNPGTMALSHSEPHGDYTNYDNLSDLNPSRSYFPQLESV